MEGIGLILNERIGLYDKYCLKYLDEKNIFKNTPIIIKKTNVFFLLTKIIITHKIVMIIKLN